jgi:hypothetical protein
MVEGHYFKIVSLPIIDPDFIMQLIWCGCKSGMPCSSRDCGYKRYGFGLMDVHVQLYMNILYMFWFLHKFKSLKCILSRYRFQIREHN